MQKRKKYRAFTLIELLVVITIIVVLLALLTPALDKAIYRAELLVCASQLRGIGTSVTMYANNYARYYPYRGLDPDRVNAVNNRPYFYDQPAEIKYHPVVTERPFDQRTTLRLALDSLNKQLNDPLTEEIDLEEDAQVIFAPYNLWWGFMFYNPPQQKMMQKIGQSFTWQDGNVNLKFDVLAGDRDMVRPGPAPQSVPGVDAQSSHPDSVYEPGILRQLHTQNEQGPWLIAPGGMTLSCWYSDPNDLNTAYSNHQRGPVDDNFVMSDLSVITINKIQWDRDEERGRIRTVPIYSSGWRANEHHYMYVP